MLSTTTVFQDQNLKRRGKDYSPVLLGLLFLRWDGSFHTYQRFFTHLAAVLETPLRDAELGTSDLVIGSDEEKLVLSTSTFQGHKVQFFGCKTHPLHLAFGRKSKTPAKTELACLKIIKQIVGEFLDRMG